MKLVYDIWFDVAAIVITTIVLIILVIQYTNNTKANLVFRGFSIVLLIAEILDLITAFTISYSSVVPIWLNLLLNSLFFFMNMCVLAVFGYYVSILINDKKLYKVGMVINIIIFPLMFILLIINIFNGMVFSFDGGVYSWGPVFKVVYIIPLIIMAEISFFILFSRKKLSNKQKIFNIVILVTIAAALLVQNFLWPEVLLTMFGASIGCLSSLFTLETPDYQELEYLRHNLENEVERQTNIVKSKEEELSKLSLEVIMALVESIDAKDKYTNGHSKRVAEYSKMLGEKAGLDDNELFILYYIALLHDVGKIGVPDDILNKPGKLTDEEFEVIKSHPTIGAGIVSNITRLQRYALIIESHHERYDGKGYPNKLVGEDIPYFARIISVADSFDAMNSKRVYRNQLSKESIIEQFKINAGTQFDPKLAKLFVDLMEERNLFD